ncbi:hypothetical protein N665_0974s0005 [Sinapis alba]|nr:hypothetical protein N665_0974s0005 [Sinapis alba]
MGPVIKLSERHLQLSGKIIHVLLARSIVTEKENELLFHFGGQLLRFSIREFHMMTGLKCIGEIEHKEDETENQDYTWDLLEGGHSLDDLEEQLSKTSEDSSDERFSLDMLLLIESILLQRSAVYKFPLENVKKAHDINVLMSYPWGREAYTLLQKSIKRAVKTKLKNVKYDFKESIPLLQSAYNTTVPILQTQEGTPSFLCEKYTCTVTPSIGHVLKVEGATNLKVTCVLPSIPHDPEDNVSMEDKADEDLDAVIELVKKGYKIKADDWRNRSIDSVDAIEEIARKSSLFGNVEIGHEASALNVNCLVSELKRLSDTMEDNFKSMSSRLSIMEEGIKDLKTRISILEDKHISDNKKDDTYHVEDEVDDTYNMEQTYTSPVSRTTRGEDENVEDEVKVDVTHFQSNEQSHESLESEGTTNPMTELISQKISTNPLTQTQPLTHSKKDQETVDDTKEPLTEMISKTTSKQPLTRSKKSTKATKATPSKIDDNNLKQAEPKNNEESKLPTLFEIGSDVEIASADDTTNRVWYSGKVVATKVCDRVEKVTVEYSTVDNMNQQKGLFETVPINRLRPEPPESGKIKDFELTDWIEGFYKGGWYSGKVTIIFSQDIYCVYLNNSTETVQLKKQDLRVHKEWVNGVWKMAEEMEVGYFRLLSQQLDAKPSSKPQGKTFVRKKRKAACSSKT